MTAHSMAGDRERCLAAGMDGYLSKPIRSADLYAVLARELDSAEATSAPPKAPPERRSTIERGTRQIAQSGERGATRSMLTINEIYTSIQGESTHAGRPCTFVRLTACDLRCAWCDTPYAFTEGRKMSLEDVVAEVDRLGCPLVEITGGEPLLQKDAVPLMERLLADGRAVLLETGGHISLAAVPRAVVKIVDVKCPGSGEADAAPLAQHGSARAARRGEVRHRRSRRLRVRPRRHRHASRLRERCAAVLFSPVHGVLDPKALSAWILEDHLPVRLQLQLHKYIWGARREGSVMPPRHPAPERRPRFLHRRRDRPSRRVSR